MGNIPVPMQMADKGVRAPNATNAGKHPFTYHTATFSKKLVSITWAMLYVNQCLEAKVQSNACSRSDVSFLTSRRECLLLVSPSLTFFLSHI